MSQPKQHSAIMQALRSGKDAVHFGPDMLLADLPERIMHLPVPEDFDDHAEYMSGGGVVELLSRFVAACGDTPDRVIEFGHTSPFGPGGKMLVILSPMLRMSVAEFADAFKVPPAAAVGLQFLAAEAFRDAFGGHAKDWSTPGTPSTKNQGAPT